MRQYTFEELYNFPTGTVLRDPNGILWRKDRDRMWYSPDWVLSSYQLELGGYIFEEEEKRGS